MNLGNLVQNQKNEPPILHPSMMIPSLEPSPELQRAVKRVMPVQAEFANPPAVRQLDAILSSIILSLKPDEHKEFLSSLAIYNAIAQKSTDALGSIHSSTPPLSLASSPGSRSDTQRTVFKLPRLESISKTFSNSAPTAQISKGIMSSKGTPRTCPPMRLPNVVDLLPLSQPNQCQGQPPLVSGIAGIDKNVDLIAIRKRKRAPRVKHYGDAQPSMHCHICCRSAKNVKVNACARVQKGTCRKVICERCLSEYPHLATISKEEGWVCSHCQGLCPVRGQCYTYGRSNLRRRENSMKRQLVKEPLEKRNGAKFEKNFEGGYLSAENVHGPSQ